MKSPTIAPTPHTSHNRLHAASRCCGLVGLALLLCGVAIAIEPPDSIEETRPEAITATDPLDDPEVAAEFEATAELDLAKQRALAGRYARIPALSEVRPEVAAGVVTLRGTVTDEARRQIAMQLAEALDGVIAVDNRLQIETALDRRLAPVLEDGIERGQRLIASLPLFALALVIVYAFHRLGRWLALRPRLFRRTTRNPFLADLLRQALGLALTIFGVLIALDLLGATSLVGAVIGAAGIAGLALGFAFKDLVENYIAGILLSLRQPFAPNDHVVIDGHEGRVATLTSRATTLITLDGNHLRLPNALVFKGVILNYSRNPTRRFLFDVGVGNQEDLAQAQALAIQALVETPGVVAEPPPGALVRALADSSVTVRCSAWVDQRQASFGKVMSEGIRAVKMTLEAAGMDLPEPIHRVQLLHPAEDVREEIGPAARTSKAKAAKRGQPAVHADIAPEPHVDRQVQAEADSQGEQNLLNPEAARE